MINLAEKIERIQKKPKHERRKIFWVATLFLVPVIFIFGIWMISLNFSNEGEDYFKLGSGDYSKPDSNVNSPDNLLDDTKNMLLNLQGATDEITSSSESVLQNPSASFSPIPSADFEENKVYFISPAPSTQ